MVTKSPKAFLQFDKSNMRQIIIDFPSRFRLGVKAAQSVFLKPGVLAQAPENIIVCGMGGSGLPGDILASIRPLDVFSHKSYGLPLQAGAKSLIVCISYSGNTEETLSAFIEASNRKLPLIALSSGGELEELARKNNIPHCKLSQPKIPPRLAVGEMFASLLQILANHKLLGQEIIEDILRLETSLKTEKIEQYGKELAKKIFKKIPVVYVPEKFQEVGVIWKNSLNETAKIFAATNYFPELNHNETVGFWKINEMQISNDKLFVVILKDAQSHPRILKQMEITKDLINKEGVKVEFIDIKGEGILEKFFSSTVLGFWTSYHLALLYKVNPTEIKIIEEFKKRLAKP